MQIAVARVVESGLPLIFANQVGGQDELVFDGASFGLNADRTLAFQMPQFETGVALTRWERGESGWRCVEAPRAELPLARLPPTGRPACLAFATTSRRTASPGVVLGLSGGIDSAVCAAMAVDALGRRACPLRHAPLSLHVEGEPRRCGRLRQASRHPLRRVADRAGGRRFRRDARPALRQPAARHHRGEHPVARARHGADGGLQQARR